MTIRILIADDEPAARFALARALERGGYEVIEAADGKTALEILRASDPELAFLDLNMPGLDGRAVLRGLSGASRRGEIVVVTAIDSVDAAVECMRLGAADYITKPFDVERIRAAAARVARRVALERRVERLESQLDERRGLGGLVGASEAMRRLYGEVERAARAPLDVLIRGETGTGKEIVAREIHILSGRSGPFVAVNTAAIAESELFGHVRGAFTGAENDRAGLFREAHGGTLFLDEIGDMPLGAQAKILRALQERAVQPVGSERTVRVDVRVITATHQDLAEAVKAGHFRQDLLYRVRGIEIAVPPLRARIEDVPALAEHFLARLEREWGRDAARLSSGALRRLLAHSWPGNVRELEHAVRAAAVLAAGEEIAAEEIRLEGGQEAAADGPDFREFMDLPLTEAKARLGETFERRAIRRALDRHEGNISAAARQLGIHRQSLQQKMEQLGIER